MKKFFFGLILLLIFTIPVQAQAPAVPADQICAGSTTDLGAGNCNTSTCPRGGCVDGRYCCSQLQSIPIPIVGAPTGILVPGQDCGAMNQKCCYYAPVTTNPVFPKPNIPGIDQLIDILNGIYDQAIKPRIIPLNNMVQSVAQPCIAGTLSTPGDPGNPNCRCIEPTKSTLVELSKLCLGASPNQQGDCADCFNNKKGIWTSVGCVYPTIQNFIEKTLLSWGVGLAGIISLLCIVYAAFMMQTSQGSPEKVKKAQELLTSCIMGLMLIVFSIFILKLIGVEILRIPGFTN